ncbi:MAG: hypothetical protein ACXWG7_03850 [Chthoniobacterales bacterium]
MSRRFQTTVSPNESKMSPLRTNDFPTDATELERLLNQSLERFLGPGTKLLAVAFPSAKQIEISASVGDLEAAITQLAKREAAKQGAIVEEVRLNFRQISPRALEAEAKVRARKMFFATTVRITGRLAINEQLTAAISDLNCSGEGAIGSMACGFLAPHLAKLNGRTFPLSTLFKDQTSLRDVRVGAGEKLSVTAELAA